MTNLASKSGLRAPSVARIGELLSSAFGFLVHTDRRQDNPVFRLAHPISLKGTDRQRLFDDAAIKLLWNTFCTHSVDHKKGDGHADETSRLATETSLALRFCMLTLCRRAEAAGARWAEIDHGTKLWTVPGSRTKNGKAHVVPLSPAALAVLGAAAARKRKSKEFVFPAPDDAKRSISEERMTRAVKRLCARLGLADGSPHDFRRSGSTALTGRYGFAQFHVEFVLGHSPSRGAIVAYDKHDFLREKRACLDQWARHVADLAEGREPAANVVELRPSKGAA
jgi:integrase